MDEKKLAINNLLNKIIAKFNEKKRNRRFYVKTQAIFRNLGMHLAVMSLFDTNSFEANRSNFSLAKSTV